MKGVEQKQKKNIEIQLVTIFQECTTRHKSYAHSAQAKSLYFKYIVLKSSWFEKSGEHKQKEA